ncbi:MAG: hypothetical protein JXB13_02095, partial [Phycisphaerae bacterium]|nr:hypothetical protein [Phycisphaerae bacterium]
RPARVWKPTACAAAAVMLIWPAMRMFPAAMLDACGARVIMHVEVTGVVIPASLLFSIAARHVLKRSERRGIRTLLVICGAYFLLFGKWMVRPPLSNLGPTRLDGSVCIQSTSYTCVAASLVTLLHAYGVETSETEMARLTQTEQNFGATDSRAVRGLERKLADTDLTIHYENMDYARLCEVPMPCVVPINWRYYVSHMVPVLSADADSVTLGDPLEGIRRCSSEEFRSVWRRRGIYLQPVTTQLTRAGLSDGRRRSVQ